MESPVQSTDLKTRMAELLRVLTDTERFKFKQHPAMSGIAFPFISTTPENTVSDACNAAYYDSENGKNNFH
jgi:hypothetical protein